MGELINHYYAGGPSYTYRSFFWEIPNYDNQSQDKCLSRADATERYSDSVGKLENLYQVKEDCMEEIMIYSPVEYVNPEAYRIVTYKELELIPVITKFRLSFIFKWGSDNNEPQLLVLNYSGTTNGGYFVPESFNINTDNMRDYIVDNDGYAIYNDYEYTKLTPSTLGSILYNDILFGQFYNDSNKLITTDNKYFPIFENSADVNFGGFLSNEFDETSQLYEILNGRPIGFVQKYLLNYQTDNGHTEEKMAIYNSYRNKIGSYDLRVLFTITVNNLNSATIIVNNDTSLTYNFSPTIITTTNENGEKVTGYMFECKMPKISFQLI